MCGREKGCGGYKTTLTWGNGVASRGKLRGLSLPVPGNTQKPLARQRNSIRKGETVKSEPLGRRLLQAGQTLDSTHLSPNSALLSSNDPNHNLKASSATWQPTPSNAHIWTPFQTSSGQNAAVKVSSVHSTLEEELPRERLEPPEFPAPSRQLEAYDEQTFAPSTGSAGPCKTGSYLRHVRTSRKPHAYSSNVTSTLQRHDAGYLPVQKHHESRYSRIPSDVSSSGNLACATEMNKVGQLGSVQLVSVLSQYDKGRENEVQAEVGHAINDRNANIKSPITSHSEGLFEKSAVMLSPFSGIHTIAIGKTPRMQYLINYYSEVISPVIVAFDGPTNPYRSCILRLASGSETLQHAISALSASNLRQRRESGELSTGKTDPARRSSRAHLTLTDEAWQSSPGYLSVGDQRNEEKYHKNATVDLIQRQLADPSQHREDSVLATLLIICLFHICESGVAKLKRTLQEQRNY